MLNKSKISEKLLQEYDVKNSKGVKYEDQIPGMCSNGMSTRDINSHLKNIYGIDPHPTLISNITNNILPLAKEWQNRPLEQIYPIIFLDSIPYKVRTENKVIDKTAYAVIGINIEGFKEVLGIWICENESEKYWLTVLTDIKNRGVKDILIASVDGLTGFNKAIKAVFPNTEIQKCLIHHIRNSFKYVSYEHTKEFSKDLTLVYTASTEKAALIQLDLVEKKWDKTYSVALKSWRNNWDELATFFKYPSEIRKLIYTTSHIENCNRELGKVIKSKGMFPTDDALHISLYLATMDISEKATQKTRNWAQVLDQLTIHFEERFTSSAIFFLKWDQC